MKFINIYIIIYLNTFLKLVNACKGVLSIHYFTKIHSLIMECILHSIIKLGARKPYMKKVNRFLICSMQNRDNVC